jgi:hypothetical protein
MISFVPVTRRTSLGAFVILGIFAGGCGDGSDEGPAPMEAIGQGSVVARCKHAMLGKGVGNWRDDATAAGRLGFVASGRDFRTAQKVSRGSIRASHPLPSSGPILGTKVPMVVEGTKPIEVSITPPDRARAGLVLAIQRGGPYAEIRFVPCRDQPRTSWPGGWVLRDREPVRVLIQDEDRPAAELVVGGPIGAGG